VGLVDTWCTNGHALEVLRLHGDVAPTPRALTDVEVARLVRFARTGRGGAPLRAWRLLVESGVSPIDAAQELVGWNLMEGMLPSGQLMPRPLRVRDGDDAYHVVAGMYVSHADVQEMAAIAIGGRKIQAIKRLRSLTRCGLKEGKTIVEHWMKTGGGVPSRGARPGMRRGKRADRARLALERAIDALILDRPLHWVVLALTRIEEDPSVPTMAVGLDDSGELRLFYNPGFVLEIAHEERMGVLLHEIDHVIFGHLGPRPEDAAKHPRAWIVATECIANEYVPYPLPGDAFTLSRFGLPAGKSTSELYEMLRSKEDQLPAVEHHHLVLSPLRADATSHRDTLDGRPPAPTHIVNEAAHVVGEEIDRATRDRLQHHPGLLSGRAVEQFLPEGISQLPWTQLLRRRVRGLLTRYSTRRHPSRRHPDLVGIVPGRRRRRERPVVMAAVDTSGSMSHRELQEVVNELQALVQQQLRVALVQCDTEIGEAKWLPRELRTLSMVGRGGTDLRPPFAPGIIERFSPSLIVYFTDGYGPAPERAPPGIDVLWVLTGRRPAKAAKWGATVCLRARRARDRVRNT